MHYNVYGMGNALVDMEFEVSDAFLESIGVEKGFMTLVDEERQFSLLQHLRSERCSRGGGGSAANTVVATALFGGSAFYSCVVSDDELGDFYEQELRKAHVDTTLSGYRAPGGTGKCLVMVTPDAERTMNTFLGVSETLNEKALRPKALEQSEFFYVEGYLVTSPSARPAAAKGMDLARKNRVKTALSFSDPSMVKYFRLGLEEVLGTGVDLLFCNAEEALLWGNCRTLALAVESLKEIAATFVITCGRDGALLFDGQRLHEVRAYLVEAVDTNGAGDMFAGAFLYGITHGMTFPEAARFGNLAASKVVAQFGPRLNATQCQALLAEFSHSHV